MAKVLVVDDDDNMRRLIKAILERRGHEVSEARDDREALSRFDDVRPDLVVTDAVMPGMGGLALVAELHRRQPPPKVLMVSGKQVCREGQWSTLAADGLIGFLGNPFTPAEISQSVHALVGSHASRDRF
jgi:CheY-like chemotaxis protein